MEELKELFGDNSLNYDEFSQKLTEAKDSIQLANLASHQYVARDKFEKVEKSASEYKEKYDTLFASVGDYDKLKQDFDDINTKYGELLAKQDLNDKMELISKANVQPRFAKFVYSEVSALTDDKKDFQTALNEYVKQNAQFVNGGKSTFVDLQNGIGSGEKSDNAKINEQIRNIRSRNTI